MSEGLSLVKAKLKAMEFSDEELRDLLENMDALEAARMAMLRQEMGRGGQGGTGGEREAGEDPKDAQIVNQRQKAFSDPKGQQRIAGFGRGGVWSPVKAQDVGGAFKQAVQDAPEAIERQRVPPGDAAEMTKGYFQKLGGQR